MKLKAPENSKVDDEATQDSNQVRRKGHWLSKIKGEKSQQSERKGEYQTK